MNTITVTPNRLISRGIRSRREVLKQVSDKSPRTREPLIAFDIKDMKTFFQLTALSSPVYRAKALRVTPSYLFRELQREDNDELNDVIGCRLLSLINEVYHFIPKDLPHQIVAKFLEEKDGFIDGKPHTIKEENIKEAFLNLYPTLFKLGDLNDDFFLHQFQEMTKLSPLSVNDFIELFSIGEIPEGYKHVRVGSIQTLLYRKMDEKEYFKPYHGWTDDKMFRLWLALGLHYKLVDKQKIIDTLDSISMDDYLKFEVLRNRFFG